MARNLINLEDVSKSYGKRPVLDHVSLGIGEGERIGIVGRNGGGKTTLLRVLGGAESADSGRVTHSGDLHLGLLSQIGDPDPAQTVRTRIVGDLPEHEWASDAKIRDVLTGLLGGYTDDILDRSLATLSGGELRRVELAHLLTSDLDLLLLDEPTNHLDVEAVAWLAGHLKRLRGLAIVVVTHDRWFLDELSDVTWEVVNGQVEAYEGGYSAYVLAKAERSRQAAASEARRNNLLRKELAWLRRGAPARTTKPKFRVDAANELITSEPPPRDNIELMSFAGARLGKTVYEMKDVSITLGDKVILKDLTWNIGPGDRFGILGTNGVGKTTLIKYLLEERKADHGTLKTGVTVKPAYLSQHLDELNPNLRVLEAVEEVSQRVDLGKGRELTASQLCERLGFDSGSQWTPVGELSGGERRRLQLTRLLMSGPNVLIMDEPTNDFDVETLAALEDLLDGFAGTIIVISHDRYFLERVADRFYAMLGDGKVRDLPGGVDQYLELRRSGLGASAESARLGAAGTHEQKKNPLSAAEERTLQKQAASFERQTAKLQEQAAKLHVSLAEAATNFEKLSALNTQLREVEAKIADIEGQWLEVLDKLS